jgi:hypothetical protein
MGRSASLPLPANGQCGDGKVGPQTRPFPPRDGRQLGGNHPFTLPNDHPTPKHVSLGLRVRPGGVSHECGDSSAAEAVIAMGDGRHTWANWQLNSRSGISQRYAP